MLTDYNIRDAIGDDWQGPGNVITLFSDEIRDAAVNDASFRGCVLNVCLHEIAHLLPVQEVAASDDAERFDCPEVREYQLAKWVEGNATPDPHPNAAENVHNAKFIRRTVHLLSRSLLAGWSVPSFNLFGGDVWFSCQPAHYLVTLLSELIEMRDKPFCEIESSEAPAAFIEQWEASVAFYETFQTPRKTK